MNAALNKIFSGITSGFLILNVILCLYMSYETIRIAVIKCKCAVLNVYWLVIILYFVLSTMYLVYSMMVTYGYADGKYTNSFMWIFILSTIAFVIGSFWYIDYLKKKKCECVDDSYKKLLRLITKIRVIIIILLGVALVIWGIYILFKKL